MNDSRACADRTPAYLDAGSAAASSPPLRQSFLLVALLRLVPELLPAFLPIRSVPIDGAGRRPARLAVHLVVGAAAAHVGREVTLVLLQNLDDPIVGDVAAGRARRL